MPSKNRPDPVIPDHEILRKIGGGAYGEVWLGRGVTGALRAVKVVWREDFDDARGFEREFEGILKFEPISRDHPGLVHILHVGRSPDGVSFYYYVMELGDDVRSGQDINPIEYEPRTLRADTKQALSPQLDVATCIDVGLRLAEALDHLHERGLAHRDVKPSNVIFLNGRAKLADIGLVAARDQRTFVGTEGFVPPEGPGSAQADVYSLGKVLYEIATGKDRLDFPELPDQLPSGPDRKRWLELNKIICDICEPRLSKRLITTAADLAEALRRLQRGKKRRSRGGGVWITTLLLFGFTGWAGYELWKSGVIQYQGVERPPERVERKGSYRIVGYPQGAEIVDETGRVIDTIPMIRERIGTVGKPMRFEIRNRGFLSRTMELVLSREKADRRETEIFEVELKTDQPPVPGEIWRDHLGVSYTPKNNEHVSEGWVTQATWVQFNSISPRKLPPVVRTSEKGRNVDIVLVSKDDAIAYCDWVRTEAIKGGLLNDNYEVVPDMDLSFKDAKMGPLAEKENFRPFYVKVAKIDFGMLKLATDPPGTEVFIDGMYRGLTDGQVIEKVKPGKRKILLVKEGFDQKEITQEIVSGQISTPSVVKLEKNAGVVFGNGKEWKNSLGMEFVALGDNLMVSKWETRRKDFDRFVRDYNAALAKAGNINPDEMPMPLVMPPGSDTEDPLHPVTSVTRDLAEKFCEWLTALEQEPLPDKKDILITRNHVYRLPTDLEWSRMSGLENEHGTTPLIRDGNKVKTFPWGDAWPPPPGAGNFADSNSSLSSSIPIYEDPFPDIAKVGSFPPNKHGIYDLCGNAQEWVSTPLYGPDEESGIKAEPGTLPRLGVLRGGGWDSFRQEELYTGTRNIIQPGRADKSFGFRVVLARIPLDAQANPLDPAAPQQEPDSPSN
jgi:serine/threonine protein kinase/formylglycine-generating enzyme required for sulfatase activity